MFLSFRITNIWTRKTHAFQLICTELLCIWSIALMKLIKVKWPKKIETMNGQPFWYFCPAYMKSFKWTTFWQISGAACKKFVNFLSYLMGNFLKNKMSYLNSQIQEHKQNTDWNHCTAFHVRFKAEKSSISQSRFQYSQSDFGHEYCWKFNYGARC